MKRRQVLSAGCAACAGLLAASALGETEPAYLPPGRFDRPDAASDEGGLWALMDREEKALRRSPLVLRDDKLRRYVQDLACQLGGEHCPDIRVLLVRTPQFNASMAPNGMMQVWTGLLLRVENEAQLAAVIGHEIGHYLQRHSVARLRDIKEKAAASQVLSLFGLAGALGAFAVLASAYAYGRDHEREADRVGAYLMHRAGFSVSEAAKVWSNLLDEARAREGREPSETSPLFATHPVPPERRDALGKLAEQLQGGTAGRERYAEHTRHLVDEWLQDEVKRGQYAESLVLLNRQVSNGDSPQLAQYYRGEVHRLRGEPGDLDQAWQDYQAATGGPRPAAQAFRGIGLLARQKGLKDDAKAAFARYLELAPQAPDVPLIKSYLAELEI